MNETRSSLLPTAIVLPSGAQAILIFSPLVEMVAAAFDDLDSQIRTEKGKNHLKCSIYQNKGLLKP